MTTSSIDGSASRRVEVGDDGDVGPVGVNGLDGAASISDGGEGGGLDAASISGE